MTPKQVQQVKVTKKQFSYSLDGVVLDFTLRTDVKRELSNFLQLLEQAAIDVRSEIDNERMKTKLKVGDKIMIEQAWEDGKGNYHDEPAKILVIDETGEMKLDFYDATPQVKEFLDGTDGYMVQDYEGSFIT